ncbi:MAG TPA: aminotransferase class III-fold pyridoxal phosphate-dependent enzyme, partial [bacterium]|nr:aminotransferase class III-fold pyridoxal phosphate-dependent enzyme [bacterium]
YGGKKEIFELISPLGKIYQASTFAGNPVSVIAGLTVLNILFENRNRIYRSLEELQKKIRKGLHDIIEDLKISGQINSIASMFQIFFTDQPVLDYISAKSSDKSKFMKYQLELLKKGVFIPPSPFETCFISTAHSEEDINKTIEIMESAIKSL